MKKRTRVWGLLIGVVLVLGVVQRVHGDYTLRRLTRVERSSGHRWSTEERAALRQVRQLWIYRQEYGEEQVGQKLVAFLSDPSPRIHLWAARYLGRLEWPGAEEPLAQYLAKLQPSADADGCTSVQLRLALERVRARDQHGWKKVNVIAASVGVDDVRRLSATINDPDKRRGWAAGSPADTIFRELVDVLYRMGKEGEDIAPMIASLALTPGQQVLLRSASLPDDQEITCIMDYLASLPTDTGDGAYLGEEHLESFGMLAADRVSAKLQEMAENPQRYSNNFQHTMINLAGRLAARSSLPALKVLEAGSNRYVAIRARAKREWIDQASKEALPI